MKKRSKKLLRCCRGPFGEAHLKKQKFFGSFFQKGTSSFFALSVAIGVASMLLVWPAAEAAANLGAPDVHVEVYSDACHQAGSDAVVGERIIVFAAKKTFVLYQKMNGQPVSQPLWAEADIHGPAMRFVLHSPQGGDKTFAGAISPQDISGAFSDGGKTVHLPRRATTTDATICP